MHGVLCAGHPWYGRMIGYAVSQGRVSTDGLQVRAHLERWSTRTRALAQWVEVAHQRRYRLPGHLGGEHLAGERAQGNAPHAVATGDVHPR